MMLSNAQHAELEALGPATVRLKLTQYGAGRGASIGGFRCGDITRGDIEDWLVEKNAEEAALQRGTLRWAKIAGWAGIISVITTVLMGASQFTLANSQRQLAVLKHRGPFARRISSSEGRPLKL